MKKDKENPKSISDPLGDPQIEEVFLNCLGCMAQKIGETLSQHIDPESDTGREISLVAYPGVAPDGEIDLPVDVHASIDRWAHCNSPMTKYGFSINACVHLRETNISLFPFEIVVKINHPDILMEDNSHEK